MTSRFHEWLQTLPSLTPHELSEMHIDALSPKYKNSSTWIQGTLACLEEAASFATQHPFPGVICAAFALTGGADYLGINYRSCGDLQKEFDLTPPSLYYFGANGVPWNKPIPTFKRVDVADFPADSLRWVLLHLEYLEEPEPEYRRSLWVVPVASLK